MEKTNTKKENEWYEEPVEQIRQNSSYNEHCKAAPDNNIFWEERSNPLSSKGN